jgi:hypothetical protein
MIKREIISSIKNLVGRVDPTQDFHNRVLESVCERVLIEMYSDLYKLNPRLLDLYTKQYGVTTPITIKREAATGLHYSTLPVKICNLPCKSSGVRHIFTLVRGGNIFVPMDAREADIIFNTDIAVVTSKVGYQVRQDTRVDYYGASSLYTNGTTVVMDLLVPFSQYGENDVVMIPELTATDAPAGRYGNRPSSTFMERVLSLLQIVPPSNLDDSNTDAREQQANKQ